MVEMASFMTGDGSPMYILYTCISLIDLIEASEDQIVGPARWRLCTGTRQDSSALNFLELLVNFLDVAGVLLLRTLSFPYKR